MTAFSNDSGFVAALDKVRIDAFNVYSQSLVFVVTLD